MASPALLIVVFVLGGPADQENEALLAAAHSVLGSGAEIESMSGDVDASQLAKQRAATVARVEWIAGEQAKARLSIFQVGSEPLVLELGFHEEDEREERGRTLGLALAAAIPLSRAATTVARQDAPPSSSRSAAQSAAQAAPAPAPKLLPEASLYVAAAGSVSSAALEGGAKLEGELLVAERIQLRAGVSLQSGEPVDARGTLTTIELGVGPRLIVVPERPFGLGLSAGVLALHRSFEPDRRAGGGPTSEWMPGAELALDASWAVDDMLSLVVSLGGVATPSLFQGISELGVRARF